MFLLAILAVAGSNLTTAIEAGLSGVMLAKTEAAEHVTETFDRLGGATPVLALVESALGIEESVRIAQARGAFRLAFGSGDYRRDTGTSADDLAMTYPRSRLVVASRIGGLPGPIDGPTVSSSHPVLREQTAVTVSLGGAFHSRRLAVKASQVGTVSPARRGSRTFADRLALALDLLRDPAFDTLLTGESPFGELPGVMARLAAGSLPALCHSITYEGA